MIIKLLIANRSNGLLAEGTFGSGNALSISGVGTRMFFYPKKAAFRAGYVTGTQWDNANIGDYSIALGYGTKASGTVSFAMGVSTEASGYVSAALGQGTIASGDNSTAMGYNTTASASGATAMGAVTTASANTATAMGFGTTASATTATAMGYLTTASGLSSTALGQSTIASGDQSTAMGSVTTASGQRSIAMGSNTTASGDNSTAMGQLTTASGFASTAMGGQTAAGGANSTAMGVGTIASAMGETTIGTYNTTASASSTTWVATDRLFTIGNGESISAKSNALVMLKNGNTTFTGNVTGPSFTSPSDKRFKQNITSLANVSGSALHNLANIGSYYYNYRVEEFPERQFPKDRQVGFIAQEVEAIYPELVITDEQGYKKVDYAKVTPILVEAIKELKAQNEALKAENKQSSVQMEKAAQDFNALKAEVEALKNVVLGNANK